jgi:transcriptional regulator with XRE-family HTH domain
MIANNASDLGALLRTARRAKGMSQQDLADAIGVTRQWVIGAEKGAPTARIDLMLAALRHTDMLVDVVKDESQELLDTVLGGRDG